MSKIDIEHGLDDIIKTKGRAFILFYASWCPHSQRFLPIFEKHSKGREQSCMRVMIDDKASIMDEYSVEYVPTVLVFENGKLIKRLDAVPGLGLNEKQLIDLLNLH